MTFENFISIIIIKILDNSSFSFTAYWKRTLKIVFVLSLIVRYITRTNQCVM